jgi:hypothetical protein
MTTVRINYKEVGSSTEKVALLSHYEIQARKAARRLRTALAKWQITRKGIEGAVEGKAATVVPLANELIKWVNDAIDWSKSAELGREVPEPKKTPKTKKDGKKAAASESEKAELYAKFGMPKLANRARKAAAKTESNRPQA